MSWPGHTAQIRYLGGTGRNVEKSSAGLQQYLVKSISSRKRSFSSLSNADWQSHGLDSWLQELRDKPRLQQGGQLAGASARRYGNSGCRGCRGQREQGLAEPGGQRHGQRLETWLSHWHVRSCYRQLRHWELGNHRAWQGLAHGQKMRANGD